MKRKLDFELKMRSGLSYIFRFYPRQPHCHSFNDKPPKTHDDIYKVYFSYAVWQKWENAMKLLWESGCDECSAMEDVSYVCDEITNDVFSELNAVKDDYKEDIVPMGEGIIWTIHRANRYGFCESADGDYSRIQNVVYEFLMSRWDGVSYRFELSPKRTKEFGEFLKHRCDYMLEHGEPI